MKAKRSIRKWMVLAGLVAVFTMAEAAMAEAASGQQSGLSTPAVDARRVVVSVPDRKLAVIEGGRTIRVFPVAVGARTNPTPSGSFRIVSRLANPTYYHPGVVIRPGRNNPIGPRWIGLNRKGYGIHGTNEPHSVGFAASHGCVRMTNRDIREFFTMVRVGDTVEIYGERDQQTAQIFSNAAGELVAEARMGSLQGASGK